MLPGFPNAALWVVLTITIMGLMLVYFGWMARGRARVFAMLIGFALLGFVVAPAILRALDRNPQLRDCLGAVWTTRSTACLKNF